MSDTQEQKKSIRALSYNIRHGEGMDRKIDLVRIAEVIKSISPDVVSLQEVDINMERTGGIDQPAELANLTGLNVAFGPAIIRRNSQYGNAILSCYPLSNVENCPLPGTHEPRAALVADLDISSHTAEKIQITFIATHLALNEESRLRSVNFIEASLIDPQTAALLAGDLNARPESQTIDEFRKVWKSATENRTYITLIPKPTQIDYILFRPGDRWKVIDTWVVDEQIASDHLPLVANLEFWRCL